MEKINSFLEDLSRSSFRMDSKGEFNISGYDFDILSVESGIFLDCNDGCIDKEESLCSASEDEQDLCEGFQAIYINFKNSKNGNYLNIVWYDNEEKGKYVVSSGFNEI